MYAAVPRMIPSRVRGKGSAASLRNGGCRVLVNNSSQFACVDGPFFDGHQIDWEGLFSRRNAYVVSEVDALPQSAGSRGSKSCGTHDPRHALKVLT